MEEPALIQLANREAVNQVRHFGEEAARLDAKKLADDYRADRGLAPRRAESGKDYFLTRSGIPGKGEPTSRREEHLAVALFNTLGADGGGLAMVDDDSLRILDYQFPLKASRSDPGVGKIDLLGAFATGRLAVVELKYLPPEKQHASSADTPLRAFLEGLAYCSIVEANLASILEQAREHLGLDLATVPPALVVLANQEYWDRYLEAVGPTPTWADELDRLGTGIGQEVDVPVSFLSLDLGGALPLQYDAAGKPRLATVPRANAAW